jgi:hypothetical protein
MWFNLAWFAPEFHRGAVTLPDKTTASVRRFVEKAAGFSERDITEMVAEQLKDHAERGRDSPKAARRRAD